MSLKLPHIRLFSVLTLALMLWDTFGWFGSNLAVKYLSAGEGHHCMVSFCTCIVEDGVSFCTCHHPELQGKRGASDENALEEAGHGSHSTEWCFFTGQKERPNNDRQAVIVVSSEYHAILEFNQPDIKPGLRPLDFNLEHFSFPDGYRSGIYRPPCS